MANKTANYQLNMPKGDDYIDIDQLNDNAKIIDAEIKKLNDGLNDVDNKFVNLKADINDNYLNKTSYTAADVLTKLKTVDGSGSGLDADTVDGAHYTAADVLSKLKTVDGSGSGLDADLFKGKSVIPVANGGTGSSDGKAFVQNLLNTGGVSVIRQVIRGVVTMKGQSGGSTSATTISIKLTNCKKAFVLLSGGYANGGSQVTSAFPYLKSLTNTSMTLDTDAYWAGFPASYEIVEFY